MASCPLKILQINPYPIREEALLWGTHPFAKFRMLYPLGHRIYTQLGMKIESSYMYVPPVWANVPGCDGDFP
jgi:hypothetical protein